MALSARLPALVDNPLVDHQGLVQLEGVDQARRDQLIRQFSFALPTEEALRSIADVSPAGVVELGAGTGYWARLLHERGVDVVAYDICPPPARDNQWFAGATLWYPVERGDETAVQQHAERTLLLVWPTRNEVWAARAAASHHDAGGRSLVYVGEGPGGHTGDDELHALLGHYDRCAACAYGATNCACVCGVEQCWQRQITVGLPHWEGFDDDLHVYLRLDPVMAVVGDDRGGGSGKRGQMILRSAAASAVRAWRQRSAGPDASA